MDGLTGPTASSAILRAPASTTWRFECGGCSCRWQTPGCWRFDQIFFYSGSTWVVHASANTFMAELSVFRNRTCELFRSNVYINIIVLVLIVSQISRTERQSGVCGTANISQEVNVDKSATQVTWSASTFLHAKKAHSNISRTIPEKNMKENSNFWVDYFLHFVMNLWQKMRILKI